MWNLDGIRANAPVTAEGGVVGDETIFIFRQDAKVVEAIYAGGQILRGFLVGVIEGDTLRMQYTQLDIDGRLDGGHSTCNLERTDDDRIRIVEHFEWTTREGHGTNVIEQLPDEA
jgi:hypothetical protein